MLDSVLARASDRTQIRLPFAKVSMFANRKVRTSVCLYECINACMYVRMYECINACMYVRRYSSINVCMHVCICLSRTYGRIGRTSIQLFGAPGLLSRIEKET